MTISSTGLNTDQILKLIGRVRNLTIFVALMAFSLIGLNVAMLVVVNNWNLILVVAGFSVMFFGALANIYDLNHNQLTDVWRMVVLAQFAYLFSSFILDGMGLWNGIIVLLLTIALAAQLPRERIPRWIPFLTVINGAGTYLVDLYWPLNQFSIPMPWLIIQIALIAISIIVYTIFSFQDFAGRPLRTKLITTFALVTLIALIPIVGYLNYSTASTLTERENQKLARSAEQVAYTLDQFVEDNLNAVQVEAELNSFAEYLQLPITTRNSSRQYQSSLDAMRTFSQKDPFIISYSLLNTDGYVVLDSINENTGRNFALDGFFTVPMRTGLPYMSPVFVSEDGKSSKLYFSTLIRDDLYTPLGVLWVQYNGDVLQDQIEKFNNQAGLTSFAVLVDELGIRLAHGRDKSMRFTSVTPFDESITSHLQSEGRLPVLPESQLSTDLPELEQYLQTSEPTVFTTDVGEARTVMAGESNNSTKERVALDLMGTQPWKVLFSQDDAITVQPLARQSQVIGVLIMSISVLLILVSYGVSIMFVSPVQRLTDAASKIAEGDFDVIVPERYDDEFGLLSKTFNSMTRQINQSLVNLESRVADRTTDIEHRASLVQAAAETGNVVATIRDQDQLLPQVTELISERFGFYHVGIFLLDSDGEYAVLTAANSEGGKRMLERGHRLQVGTTGIVGYVTSTGQPRISLDVGDDAVFFNNPDLPETRSEMALPLSVRNQVIGALDIQSVEPNAFDDADITILRIVADQVAISIENARLFEELQESIEATRRAYGDVTAMSWRDFSEQRAVQGYLVRSTDMTVPIRSNQGSSFDPALSEFHKGSVVQLGSHTLIVPVKIRESVVGGIRLQKRIETYAWTEEEIAIMQTLSDQLAAALENARLYNETRRRAARDRMVRDISDKMRRAPDMDSLIQTAIQEMARALGVEQGFAQISTEAFTLDEIQGINGNGDHGKSQTKAMPSQTAS